MREWNQEYADHLQQISESDSHDRQEITSNDGNLSINWQGVPAVFFAKVSGTSDGEQVASLTDTPVNILHDILWKINDVDYSTHMEQETEVRVYSNQHQVTLMVDGQKFGELEGGYGFCFQTSNFGAAHSESGGRHLPR